MTIRQDEKKVFCNVLLRRLREAVDYMFEKNKLASDMEDAVENKFSHLRNTQEQCIDFQSTLVANSIDIKKDFDCVHYFNENKVTSLQQTISLPEDCGFSGFASLTNRT
ncbi:unnamed protein product [Clavelina lepadiformis]|uniref:Uncharacterized protein n=1 Tax=Clavelina lepadiformis TaxID=159417 RepID=A0ABP0F0A8_CLALP